MSSTTVTAAAERRVGAGELQPDHAAADDDDLVRDLAERHRIVARPHAGQIVVDAREAERNRAGSEDDGVAGDALDPEPSASCDLYLGRRDEPALAVDDADLQALGVDSTWPTSSSTTPSLRSRRRSTSTRATGDSSPNSAARLVSATMWAERRIVLVGMHPQFRHVPPRRSLSIEHDLGAEARRLERSGVSTRSPPSTTILIGPPRHPLTWCAF
jgi:hypothetical protein